MNVKAKIDWSYHFLILRSEDRLSSVFHKIEASDAQWVLIRHPFGARWDLLSREKFIRILRHRLPRYGETPLKQILTVNEDAVSGRPSRLRREESSKLLSMGGGHFLYMEQGRPVAIGELRTWREPNLPYLEFASRIERGSYPAPEEDEGSTPTRFPSIEADAAITPGGAVNLDIDLKRKPDPTTLGAVPFFPPDSDWTELAVTAVVQSHAIEFDNGGACELLVRRNDDTVAARITGRVHPDTLPGNEIEIKTIFLLGTRYCGEVVRRMHVGPHQFSIATAQPAAPIKLDWVAERPDMTVFITVFEAHEPSKQHWRMLSDSFPNRPAQMDGRTNLGHAPAEQAIEWLKRLATLERGKHGGQIAALGDSLWAQAPEEFRAFYWALYDHIQDRPLTIQFVTDDSYLPWELMVPRRNGDDDHGAIAQRHLVARWIGSLQGNMPARLPDGNLVVIAPRYPAINLAAPSAQDSAVQLVNDFGALRIGGTKAALSELLSKPAAVPIAMVYFTGHGKGDETIAQASSISLEDDEFSAGEAARWHVRHEDRHRPVFFLNACEVGASGNVFGSVGGWAHALLSRRFGGLIAPVWAIDAEDANIAAGYLLSLIVQHNRPIADALRALRNEHGDVSPTFHAYLFYGDVTSLLGNIKAK